MPLPHSDALVLFGVTGDLAHKKIFPALYALAKRGDLQIPVIGVASPKWTLTDLHHRVEDSIKQSGGIDDPRTLDHLVSLLSYVSGDYNDQDTFTKLKKMLGAARRPAHYLAIPPSLFPTVISGLSAANLAHNARVIVEKPFGRDLTSARELNGLARSVFPEDAIFRIDHFLGLVEAAEHLEAFSRYFLRDIDVEQVQMDELFALLSAVKDGEVTEAEAIKRLSRSPHWVWVAMDPVGKLILSVDVGQRTLAMAQRLVHQVTQVLAPECAPLFLTDGFREYVTALVGHYGQWIQPERRQAKGPKPKPRWMPLAGLLYAQVVKSYRRRRIVGVKHRVVFGLRETIESILAKRGWKINTSFVERLNLDFRQHVAAIGRRVNTLCKHEEGLRQQLAIFHVYHNFALPHASLRLPLPETDAIRRWQPRTPAMAAGLTDRVWSLRDILMYRVPPWPQPQVR